MRDQKRRAVALVDDSSGATRRLDYKHAAKTSESNEQRVIYRTSHNTPKLRKCAEREMQNDDERRTRDAN